MKISASIVAFAIALAHLAAALPVPDEAQLSARSAGDDAGTSSPRDIAIDGVHRTEKRAFGGKCLGCYLPGGGSRTADRMVKGGSPPRERIGSPSPDRSMQTVKFYGPHVKPASPPKYTGNPPFADSLGPGPRPYVGPSFYYHQAPNNPARLPRPDTSKGKQPVVE